MTMPRSANCLRRVLAVFLTASVAWSLFAPALHARPGDAMGCAEHHLVVTGSEVISIPGAGCGTMPDGCRLMLGCGAVAPALSAPPLAVVPVPARVVVHAAPTVWMIGLPGLGPPTPPPNS